MEKEQFIDAESEPWIHKELDYEKILLKQINLCAENLSKERIGGHMTDKGKYIGDVCSEIINSVEVLEDLMGVFLENDDEKMKEIREGLKEEIEELGKLEITLDSYKGPVKDLKTPLSPTHPIMKKRLDIEADYHKKIFAILLKVFYKNKMKIRAMGRE